MTTAATISRSFPVELSNARKIAWVAGWLLPAATVVAGLAGAWQVIPWPWGTACGMTLAVMLLVVIYTDGRWKKIPNWATYPVFVWLLGLNVAGSLAGRPEDNAAQSAAAIMLPGWETTGPLALGAIGIVPSILGAVTCFAVMVVLSGFLKSSGGDVKLMTVIGACLGIRYGLLAMLLGYIIAGTWSLVLCVWHFGPVRILQGLWTWAKHVLFPRLYPRPEIPRHEFLQSGVPLGAHFAIGCVLAMAPVIPGIHF